MTIIFYNSRISSASIHMFDPNDANKSVLTLVSRDVYKE